MLESAAEGRSQSLGREAGAHVQHGDRLVVMRALGQRLLRRNHRCTGVSGTSPVTCPCSASSTTRPRPSIRLASCSMVGASNTSRTVKARPRSRARHTSCMTRIESPPASKKLVRPETGCPPRSERQSSASSDSSPSRATWSPSESRCGAGSARQSTFPLAAAAARRARRTRSGSCTRGGGRPGNRGALRRRWTPWDPPCVRASRRRTRRGSAALDGPAREHDRSVDRRGALEHAPQSRRARSGSRAPSPGGRGASQELELPSAPADATSPVRYTRAPGAAPNGSGTKRSAVSAGAPEVAARELRATDAQLASHADGHRLAAARPLRSRAWHRGGRPIGTSEPECQLGSSADGSPIVAVTASSVGP